MYRAAHTVKGGARLLGLESIGAVAERAETVIRGLRDGAVPPGREPGARLLGAVDELAGLIWSDQPPPARSDAEAPERRGQNAEDAPTGEAGPPPGGPERGQGRAIRIPADRIDAVVGLAAEARRAAEA